MGDLTLFKALMGGAFDRLKVPMKPISFFEPMLTYYVLSQDCWI